MINALIDGNGMHRLDIAGNGADVVAEFGILINQYYSAMSKSSPDLLPGLLPGLRAAFQVLTAPESPVWGVDESVQGIFLSKKVGR